MNDQSDEKREPNSDHGRQAQPSYKAFLYGSELADRLDWLESVVGSRGRGKFEGAKLSTSALAGQYVSGISQIEERRLVVCALIDQLKAGAVAALCDIDSYYAAGRRVPLGMAIRENRLVDVWP